MLKIKFASIIFSITFLLTFLFVSCGDKKEDVSLKQETVQNEQSALESAQKTETTDATAVKVDSNIPHYTKVAGISGNLSSIGSDTMNNLLTLWLEGFKRYYPNVNIQVEGKGSSTAPPALISGTAQLGPMSRDMKQEEIDAFEKKFGYKPTELRVAIDALAVYVNKDNPLKGLTLPQVDAIFSKTRRGGYKTDIAKWGDLGLTGDWTNRGISLYGRNSASGTYGYFKEHALFKGDFKDQVKEQPGSASVVQGVTEDRYGIGYSGIGYRTSGVIALPLAKSENDEYHLPDYENCLNGKYPLSRFLNIYINKTPNKPVDPLLKEFIKFVLSYEGQEVVVKDGYLPLTYDLVKKELAKLD
ncbi:MAG: phosphate ABC transporter substrate-binding protein [Ignavibacterium sp.]|jgi:phosphate transport system substrate-binding protein|uniref:PstS family phosphate ABC transporter substrate-binding protein n=1 Tax=Ignavibacterium sp. TaxID=2651167 RepID=UPI0032969F8C